MPDRDWYDWNVPRYWRGVARRIEGGDSPQYVSDLAMAALAKSLRSAGGIPGLHEMLAVVHDCAEGQSIPQAFRVLREIRIQAGGFELVRIAEKAAQATIAAPDRGNTDYITEMGRQFLRNALESLLFGRARLYYAGMRFGSVDDAIKWERECLALMQTRADKVFQSLLKDPTAQHFRTPDRIMPKEETLALLSRALASPL